MKRNLRLLSVALVLFYATGTATAFVPGVPSHSSVEHVRPFEEARERLAVMAVTDKTQTPVWRNLVCDAAHMAARAAKRKVPGCTGHKRNSLIGFDRFRSLHTAQSSTTGRCQEETDQAGRRA